MVSSPPAIRKKKRHNLQATTPSSSAILQKLPAKAPVVFLAAGGTGGHLFPAEALGAELQRHGMAPVLVTEARALNYGKLQDGIGLREISASSFGGGFLKKCRALLLNGKGVLQAIRLIRKEKPVAIVGFGGYPSFPTMVAAILLRVPSVVHEQNAVLGRVNRLLVKHIHTLAATFPQMQAMPAGLDAKAQEAKIALVGNPVRPAILALESVPYEIPEEGGEFRIAVIGGSQGASIFSEVVPAAIEQLPEALRGRIRLTQQCRKADMEATTARYQQLAVRAELSPFFANVAEILATSHLVICRSGASTLAEVATLGRPSVLVPYPHAMDNHQFYNALYLKERNAAWLLPQEAFTAESLADALKKAMENASLLQEMANAAKTASMKDATRQLMAVVCRAAGLNPPAASAELAAPDAETSETVPSAESLSLTATPKEYAA
jgi:UDP-N-acetylglucosamine--N-acetylmuramyl-(pentapeptide) pyrophosphoryl-undecaprenol N-acetylglucosamine transferase